MEPSRLFSELQRGLVKSILNCIIPAEGERPAAGDASGVSALEQVLDPDAGLRRAFLNWLFEIDLASWRHRASTFVELGQDEQIHILTTVEQADPTTFDVVVGLVYRSYYENPRVLAALGIDSRPPQPRGYTLAAFDEAQLDQVRRRGKRFRNAPA